MSSCRNSFLPSKSLKTVVQTQIIKLLLSAEPELGQSLGSVFLRGFLQAQPPWRRLSPPGCRPSPAEPCRAARRSFSLLGRRVFPQERRAGRARSQRGALRVVVDVQQEVVVQLSARRLCRKLWRRVCKWFWNTGIRVCTKREHSKFSGRAGSRLIRSGIPGHFLRQRRGSNDQRGLSEQSWPLRAQSTTEQLGLLLLHTLLQPWTKQQKPTAS